MMSSTATNDEDDDSPTKTITSPDSTATATTSSSSSNLTLRIQTATGRPHTVSVVENASVACLKQTVIATTNTTNNPYIRLIAAGRLLAPDTALLQEFQLQSEQVVHAVIVAQQQSNGVQAAVQQGRQLQQHAGVNASGWAVRRTEDDDDDDEDGILYYNNEPEGVDDDDDNDIEAGTTTTTTRTRSRRSTTQHHRTTMMGFDRLRDAAGLSRGEITAIRIYFHGAVDRWIHQHPAIAQEIARQEPHDVLRRRRVQEERWMDAQGPASEFRINLNLPAAANNTTGGLRSSSSSSSSSPWRGVGTDRDFMWGCMLGFCVGKLMLVWVWMPTVPHKQKLGILTGYCFSLTMGMFRAGNNNNPDGDYYADDMLILSD